MVNNNESICPLCRGDLKYYDKVRRIVRTKRRETQWIKIRRLKCVDCGALHRELPDFIFPYKQYEAEVILGVLEGFITPEILGYEDYPCEATMCRWRSAHNLQVLLWRNS